MPQTFTFTGTSRFLSKPETVPTTFGRINAPVASILVESDDGRLRFAMNAADYELVFGKFEFSPKPEEAPKPIVKQAPAARRKK